MSATAWNVAYMTSIRKGERETVLRSSCGKVISLPSAQWWLDPKPEEEGVLDLAVAPVIDLGCGPGRHAIALARRGVRTLGVDSSPSAVAAARDRGASVVQRSVFDRLPGEGWWSTALLLDGNVGIAGDPVRLLRRTRSLLQIGGRVLIEAESPGVITERLEVRAEIGGGPTEWFPWARVGIDDLPRLGAAAGLRLARRWRDGGRWFARMDVR